MFSINPPSAGICDAAGGSAFDTIYFTATGTTGNTYSWAPAGSLSCTSCPNPRAYPGSNTVYTITVTGTNSCTATYYDSVTVGSITAKIFGKDSICSGDSDVLTVAGGANNVGSTTTYAWSTGQTTTQITVRPVASVTYSCYVVSGSTPCTSTAVFPVVVFPKPRFTLTGADSICYPGSTIISATSLGGNFQYSWAGPFGINYGTSDTISPNVTTTYTLHVTDFGCHLDSMITVKVTQRPIITFSGASNLCQGSSTIICASGGSQYHWSTGSTSSCINVQPFASITYTVGVRKSACLVDTTFSLTVDSIPVVKFTGDTSICTGDSTIIYVKGGYGYSFLWNTGSTADSIAGAYTAGETFYVTVTKGSCSKDSSRVSIKVYPHPHPSVFPIDTTVCQYDSVQLTAAGGNYYTWLPKNSGLNHYLAYGDTDRDNVAPKTAGTTKYTVNICTWGCCIDTSIYVNVTPGVLDYSVCCSQTVAGGTPVNLTASYASGPFSVEYWTPTAGLSCSNCNNPTATVYNNTTYTATFLDQITGCTVSDSVTIDIFNCNVFIPDVFSPGETTNNKLYVRSLCMQSMNFAVYDRFGNKIFQTADQDKGWDGTYNGKPMNIGTYVWYLQGLEYDGTRIEKSGNVVLIR